MAWSWAVSHRWHVFSWQTLAFPSAKSDSALLAALVDRQMQAYRLPLRRSSRDIAGLGHRGFMTREPEKGMRLRSRGEMRPSFARNLALLENRGRREDRVRAAPAVSCAMCTG